jgi:hypothetical protein
MPEEIINKFKDQYGDKNGEQVYYATANKQDRNPETFEKNEAFSLDKAIDEEMANIHGVVADPNAPETPTPIQNTCEPTQATPSISLDVIPPQESSPINPISPIPSISSVDPIKPSIDPTAIMEKKDKKKKLKQVKDVGSLKDRKGNKHMPPAKKVEKDKTKYDRKETEWKKFDESVNSYLTKTSRKCDIGINSLETMWKECIEAQEKIENSKNTRKFWLEVKSKFDTKVNDIFLQEAKKKMTSRQKLNSSVESFLEHVAKEKYVEAKDCIKEMSKLCIDSMICDRKVQYQKTLAEEIAKKVKEIK